MSEESNQKPIVAWIDDLYDTLTDSRACDVLTRSFDLRIFVRAIDARRSLFVDVHPVFLIVDLRMPTPEGVSRYRTANDAVTGLWLLDSLSASILRAGVGVAIVTETDEEVAAASIQDVIPDLSSQIKLFSKEEFLDYGLVARSFVEEFCC